MSLNIQGKNCPVCHAYLFEEDDIVYCPVCGAPHHRDCYNRLGRCSLEEFHGTEKQYDIINKEPEIKEEPKTQTAYIKCGMCGEKYDIELGSCPNCQTPNVAKMGGRYVVFDFLGGVPADMDLGEGVTANEAKVFVASNTQRYIPKFASMKAGLKASWNWLAFLFPSSWFFSRKMYKGGLLTAVISIACTLIQFPFQKVVNNLFVGETMGYLELSQAISENLSNIGAPIIIAAFIGVILNIALKLFSGLMGDYFYRNHTIKSVVQIKTVSEDKEADYRKLGGVSLVALILSFMAVNYLPEILFMLTAL